MQGIEFSSNDGRVSLSWRFDGDYYVVIKAKAHGFRGHADGHVVDAEFKAFAKGVQDLARSRRGEASLTSAHPGLFDLTIRSVDSVGHLGVFGSLSFETVGDPKEQQSLQFSLNFDPAQIERAASALREIAVP